MSGWGVGSLAAASQIRDSHPCLRSAAKHAIRPQHTMNYASSITDLIGNTPLLALDRVRQGGGGRVFGKCEFMNPIAIKDRPVFHMIREAEGRGEIEPGATLIEATSGNTGMALAYIGRMRGYRVVLCMSEIQSAERRLTLKALGAEVHLTPAALGTKAAKAKAVELHAATPGSFYVGQHDNLDNRRAHVETTGPEIWRDTEGLIDVFVAPLGTGGTLGGVSEAIKPLKPALRVVGVEPEEAPFISEGRFAPHRMMGTAPGFVPGVLDRSLIDDIHLVSEADAFRTCREMARKEGVLVGISSGASVCVALRLAREPRHAGHVIVCMLCDSGERYLSVDGLFQE
jgi:cysteine synthase A